MDAGQITRYKQTQAQSMYYMLQNKRGLQTQANIREGASALVSKGHTLIATIPDIVTVPVLSIDSSPPCSFRDSVLYSFNIFLHYIVLKGWGPTVASRALYIWFMATTAAWNWIQTTSRLSGIHDSWNWTTHFPIRTNSTNQDQFIWANHAIVDMLQYAFPLYNISGLLTDERNMFNWTIQEQADRVANVQEIGNWNTLLSNWTEWINIRTNDESISNSTKQPTADDAVNIGLQLLTNSATLPTFVDSTKWTPLKLPMKPTKQGYLTFFWDNVRSTGITSSQEQDLDIIADTHFITGVGRDTELLAVAQMSETLTDSQKMAAEFWAGGPNTVTPPGMFAWFWKEYIRTNTPSVSVTLFSGLDLAIHLFEGARVTWRNKSRKVQARPIQEIRILHGTETFKSWNGTDISGNMWMPYQEATFVTPPFADYPSGHSHFSQGFAHTMKSWFGPNVPTTITTKSDLILLSPIFSGVPVQTGNFADVTIPMGKSIVQATTVPAAPVTFSWNTWQGIANSAGMSRLYGGIHCMSAHVGSQAIADGLHTHLNSIWTFNRNGN